MPTVYRLDTRLRQYAKYFWKRQHTSIVHRASWIKRIGEVIEWAKVTHVSQLTAPTIEAAISDMAKSRGLSTCSAGAYYQVMRSFGRWLFAMGYASCNQMSLMKTPKLVRVYRRRVFTDDEIQRLIQTAEADIVRTTKLPGQRRAWLYRLASLTGMRRKTLLALTPGHFSLYEDPPFIIRKSWENKNRKDDIMPIHKNLAEYLKLWFYDKDDPNERLFKCGGETATNLLRKDMAVAGIPVKNAAGEVGDFHSFRHTFCTRVGMADIPLKAAMKLMGHATIDQTLSYQHLTTADLSGMLSRTMTIGLDGRVYERTKPTEMNHGKRVADGAAVGECDPGVRDRAEPGGREREGLAGGQDHRGDGGGDGCVVPGTGHPVAGDQERAVGGFGELGPARCGDREGAAGPLFGPEPTKAPEPTGQAGAVQRETKICRGCGIRPAPFKSHDLCRVCAGISGGHGRFAGTL